MTYVLMFKGLTTIIIFDIMVEKRWCFAILFLYWFTLGL